MWNDLTQGNSNNSGSASEVKYLKLKPGVTKIRVLDEEPFSRWTHWIQAANSGKGLSVDCLGKGCPVCAEIAKDKKAKATKRYNSTKSHAINILARSFKTLQGVETSLNNEVNILDKGNKIFTGLLACMSNMGDLRNYDVTITQVGEDFGSITQTVMPTFPPSPLTDEEKALPKYDLLTLKKSFTAEQVVALMNGGTLDAVNAMSDAPTVDAPTMPTTNAPVGVDFTRPV